MKTIRITGNPGSGKTTYLLRQMEALIDLGIAPEQIAFLSFGRAAIQEARSRVWAMGYDKDATHGIKTIHSMCYALLGLNPANKPVFQEYSELEATTGVQFRQGSRWQQDENPAETVDYIMEGNAILSIYHVARSRCLPEPHKKTVLNKFPDSMIAKIDPVNYEYVIYKYRAYKTENGKVDFDDMLEECLLRGAYLPYHVLFVDEFQDTTALQAKLISMWSEQCDTVYIAGDDCQTIFDWAGADARIFLDWPDTQDVILNTSHRLSRKVLDYTKKIFRRIKVKKERELQTDNPEQGEVKLIRKLQLNGELTFILHRHVVGCDTIAKELTDKQIPFRNLRGYDPLGSPRAEAYCTLHDLKLSSPITIPQLKNLINYIPSVSGGRYSVLERGAKSRIKILDKEGVVNTVDLPSLGFTPEFDLLLSQGRFSQIISNVSSSELNLFTKTVSMYGIDRLKSPLITIGTIHSVKGQERTNVILCNELRRMSYTNLLDNPDAEHRCFYVGSSRAKKNLYLYDNGGNYEYPM